MDKKRKKVGLVLGGGGSRGVAFIGVLRILKENNIPIDYIVGTSMGSIMAGTYALTKDPDFMQKMMLEELDSSSLLKLLDLATHGGFVTGQRIEDWLEKWFEEKTFADLDVPLSIVAADLNTGKPVIINTGNVAVAIRASSSIPPAIKPVSHQGRLLIDGWIADPLPIGVAKQMGADIVIGVVVDSGEHPVYLEENVTLPQTLNRSFAIMSDQIMAYKQPFADVLIKSKAGGVVLGGKPEELAQKNKLAEHIKAGEEAAIEALGAIKKLL